MLSEQKSDTPEAHRRSEKYTRNKEHNHSALRAAMESAAAASLKCLLSFECREIVSRLRGHKLHTEY
jgi:hypothetical protein